MSVLGMLCTVYVEANAFFWVKFYIQDFLMKHCFRVRHMFSFHCELTQFGLNVRNSCSSTCATGPVVTVTAEQMAPFA